MGLRSYSILPSVPLHWDAKKLQKERRKVDDEQLKMPEKKGNQLVNTIGDKKGVASMKLAVKMNVDRSFVSRIAREAVRTYKISLGQSWTEAKKGVWKEKGAATPISSPTSVVMDVLLSHNFILSWFFFFWGGGVLKQEINKGGWDPKLKRFWEVLGSVWSILAGMSSTSKAWCWRRGPTWGWLRTPCS